MRRFHVRFADRRHAGRELAAAVAHVAAERPVVLGLPRGGVVVAAEVARALAAPLDVVIVRKLGAPSQPEYAVGAIGEEDVVLIDDDVVDALELRPALPALIERERVELVRRTVRYREGRPPAEVRDRTVVLVDDGVATGSTARVAAEVDAAAVAAAGRAGRAGRADGRRRPLRRHRRRGRLPRDAAGIPCGRRGVRLVRADQRRGGGGAAARGGGTGRPAAGPGA